jgi:hypothetical protein
MSTSPRQAREEFPEKIPNRFLAEKLTPRSVFLLGKRISSA